MKFLVIGLGSIGMRHTRNLLEMGHEVYGFDMDKSKYEISGIEKEPNDLIRYDAEIICSPTYQHAKHLSNAICTYGTHVFIEKPIADDASLIAETLEEARRLNLVVMVGNNLRFNYSVLAAKEKLESGQIGRPIWASICLAQYSEKPEYLRDGVILNWGAHELDLALYLLGPAEVISCLGNHRSADIILRHEDHHQTHVHLDYLAKREVRHTLIIGESDNLEFNIKVEDQDYIDEMQAFIDRINGKETLGATGEDGLATLRIINDAQRMAGLI